MFAAIFMRQTRQDPRDIATPEQLIKALDVGHPGDVSGHWLGERALLAQSLLWNTPESKHETTPEVCPDTGRVIVSWVRLDNRAELCADLNLQDRETLTDPQIILAAHRLWGEGCANRLEGDFSFVIYDPATHEVFAARDSIGARPFFYFLDNEIFAICSTAAIFPKLMRSRISPSEVWMARQLLSAAADLHETAWENVYRLAPGCTLTCRRDQPPKIASFFEFQDTAPKTYSRDEKYVETYRAAFEAAVTSRLRSDYPIAAESSGGIDSSSIVAVAVPRLPHDLGQLRFFANCTLRDEHQEILTMAVNLGVQHTYVQTRVPLSHSERRMKRVLNVLGYPAEHSFALYCEPFFQHCAQNGLRTLLSGFGGDELVTSSATFLVPELMRDRRYKEALGAMPGRFPTRLIRFFKELLRPRDPYAKARKASELFVQTSMLRQEYIETHGVLDRYLKFSVPDPLPTTVNEALLAGGQLAGRRLGRLESCALLARSYGVEFSWPMLDRRLMQVYLATPSVEKRQGRFGRYLHRRALDGAVPDSIIWKPTKDLGGFPHWREDCSTPDDLRWSALSNGLQPLLDHQKFERSLEFLSKRFDSDAVFDDVFRAQINVDHVIQLDHWLTCDAQLSPRNNQKP